MGGLLPFIVAGLVDGAIYGLASAGLVVTYRTTGIFNFGYGALATAAAYLFYFLHVAHQMPWVPAFIISVPVFGVVLGLGMERLARSLAVQPLVYKIVGTLGILVAVQGLATIMYGVDTIPVGSYLPGANNSVHVLGVYILYSQLTIAATAVAVVVLIYMTFRLTRIGLLMRAVVDDPDLLAIEGTSPSRVRRIAWIMGSMLAALSGVLLLPEVGLDPLSLTLLVVFAFGAAAVGAFASIPLAFAGGILIGVGTSVISKYVVQISWLAGLPNSLPFILLFLALLVLPRWRLMPPSMVERRLPTNYRGAPRARALVAVLVVACLAVIPLFAGDKIASFTEGLSLMIVLLSLGLLIKTSGQISLCHAAFMAIGACAFAHLTQDNHMPWAIAFLLSSLIVVPLGALIAIPAIRLSGLFLALATFAFGIMIEQFFYPLNIMFGQVGAGLTVPRPSFAVGDNAYYYFVLGAVVLTGAVIIAIHAGRLGRILRGLSESPLALTTFGLNANVTRVIVFMISSFLAAVGGILYAGTFKLAGGGDPTFQWLFSFVLVTTLMIMPFREPWYVVPSAVGIAVPQFWTSTNGQYWLYVISGVAAIIVAVQGGPLVMPQGWRARLSRWFPARRQKQRDLETDGAVWAPENRPSRGKAGADIGLEVGDLTIRFGGLVAVDGLSMKVPTGQITGLIGPNGAGKTTTFNACSGLNRPASGSVSLHGADVSRMSPGARARRGLGRTFQRVELCDSLTVAENVALGREAGQAGGSPLQQLVASRAQYRQAQSATHEALDLCGLSAVSETRVDELPTGQRRLVEVARCLAGPFDVLLLDEPSAGLDRNETEQLGAVLRSVVETRKVGILLVEHDVNLVMNSCAFIYVLDFGKLVFSGSPEEARTSETVQAVYLGEPSAELEAAQLGFPEIADMDETEPVDA